MAKLISWKVGKSKSGKIEKIGKLKSCKSWKAGKLKSGKVGVGGKQFKGCLWPTVSRAVKEGGCVEILKLTTTSLLGTRRFRNYRGFWSCLAIPDVFVDSDSDNINGLVVPAYPGREWNLKSEVKGLHREVPDHLQGWLAASLGTCSSSWPPLWLTSATSPTTISSVNINSKHVAKTNKQKFQRKTKLCTIDTSIQNLSCFSDQTRPVSNESLMGEYYLFMNNWWIIY